MKKLLGFLLVFITFTCNIIPNNQTDPNNPGYIKPYLVFDSTSLRPGDTIATNSIALGVSGNTSDQNQYRYRVDSLTWCSWIATHGKSVIQFNITENDTGKHRLAIQTCYDQNGDITDTALTFVKVTIPHISAMTDTLQIAAPGQQLKLWVVLAGTKPITCKWFHGVVQWAGVDKDTLLIDSLKIADQGNYFCMASNRWGTDTSKVIKLTIGKSNISPRWKTDTFHIVLSEGQTFTCNFMDSCISRSSDTLTYKISDSNSGRDSLTSKGMFTFTAGTMDSGNYEALAIISSAGITDTALLKVTVLLTPTYTVPDGINTTPLSTSTIRISWRNTLRCTRYRISKALDTNGTYFTITETPATFFIDSGLTAATRYFYKIIAIYPWGQSTTSSPATVKTLPNPPAIPNIISINPQSSSELKIIWSNVNSAASGYKIYRCETKVGQFTKIYETTDTFYTDIGLVAATAYYYKATACNSGGESAQSITVSSITRPQPPAQPLGFVATPISTKKIALKWSSLVKADAYKLYRVESLAGNYLPIGATTIVDTFYNDSIGLSANTIYYYKLTGVNAGGESPTAIFANATTYPDIPSSPVITVAGGAGYADITWKPVPYALSYNLYYAIGNTVTNSSKVLNGAVSPQHISSLYAGIQYAFAVSTVGISGESTISTSQSIVTTPEPPYISAVAGNDMVTVNWDTVPGVTSYTLYISVGDTIDTTTFRYTNSKPPVVLNSYPIWNGVRYAFAAVAVNASGQSKLSNTVTCMPVLPRQMVKIPSGSFTMGSNEYGPPHQVSVSSFYMDSTPVTLADYQSIGGGTTLSKQPVAYISWYDAALFCNAISKKSGKDSVYLYTARTEGTLHDCTGLTNLKIDYSKNGYRLPTEAEYEYACRGGTTTAYYWGDTLNGDYCWYRENSDSKPHDVAQKKPNSIGLYDMSGNVWEYCNDYYANYDTTVINNPTGPATGINRTRRGGSYAGTYELQSASRDSFGKLPDSGFRCVRR